MQGVIWYQGESNTGRPDEYGALLKKLTGCWRTLWQRPDMPFCVVQLANHMEPADNPQESGWAALREQQRLTADADPYTSLAVAIDLGEASDIHPLRKREVTERCVLAFQNAVFGKKNKQTFTLGGENSCVWDARGSDIYYQGSIDRELPVSVAVSYTLDGQAVTAEDLAGKSGKVVIRFDYTNNQYELVEINGEQHIIGDLKDMIDECIDERKKRITARPDSAAVPETQYF